jgi:kynurenine formamidase
VRMPRLVPVAALAWALGAAAGQEGAPGLDLSRFELVDLSHTFDETTLYWPTASGGFDWKSDFAGRTGAGFFYSAGSFRAPEHGGTHLDAPVHFAEGQLAADALPLTSLIAPAVVLDVAEKAAADPDYRAGVEDAAAFEREHGRIAAGTIVLLRTGWSARWPDRKAVFGDDTPGDASNLHFPGYSAELVRFLIEERGAAALGIDTPSIDAGQAHDFIAHQVAAARGVPAFENVAALERLPPRGSTVFALPMKIGGGTGAPARIVALVPRK